MRHVVININPYASETGSQRISYHCQRGKLRITYEERQNENTFKQPMHVTLAVYRLADLENRNIFQLAQEAASDECYLKTWHTRQRGHTVIKYSAQDPLALVITGDTEDVELFELMTRYAADSNSLPLDLVALPYVGERILAEVVKFRRHCSLSEKPRPQLEHTAHFFADKTWKTATLQDGVADYKNSPVQ